MSALEVVREALDALCDRAYYGETPDGLKRDEVEQTHMAALRALEELNE